VLGSKGGLVEDNASAGQYARSNAISDHEVCEMFVRAWPIRKPSCYRPGGHVRCLQRRIVSHVSWLHILDKSPDNLRGNKPSRFVMFQPPLSQCVHERLVLIEEDLYNFSSVISRPSATRRSRAVRSMLQVKERKRCLSKS
jgi:hypothetical protein